MKKIDEFDTNFNYDTENLLEFLTAYTRGMDKIIDNVVPTKKAKVHTRKVCQPWYNNILRDQKTKVHKREMFGENIKKIMNGWHFKWRDPNTSECLVQLGNSFTVMSSKN